MYLDNSSHKWHIPCLLSFNLNPFSVSLGKSSRNFFHADLTLAITSEPHPLSASRMAPK